MFSVVFKAMLVAVGETSLYCFVTPMAEAVRLPDLAGNLLACRFDCCFNVNLGIRRGVICTVCRYKLLIAIAASALLQ